MRHQTTTDATTKIKKYTTQFQSTPLNLKEPPVYTPELLNYFNYYKIHYPHIPHHFGTIDGDNRKIAAHVYHPPGAKKTLYLIHGYLLHSSSYYHLIKLLLENGYALVTFDLPGHGYSTGQEAHIDDFSCYVEAFKNLLDKTLPYLPEPETLMGISTGGAVMLEYLFYHQTVFKSHIMASPLVRSACWGLSKFGMALIGGFIKRVPTITGYISADPEDLQQILNDPLKRNRTPLSWVKALFRWNDKIHLPGTGSNEKVLIIQGDRDTVVDWRYNLPFLQKKLPNMELYRIPGAAHELFFEKKKIRKNLFNIMLNFIKT